MSPLIAIAGVKCSGKSTLIKSLVAAGCRHVEIARPIKVAAKHLYGLTDEEAFDDAVKDLVVNRTGLTPRQMQLRVGELGREGDPDRFIRRAIERTRAYRLCDHEHPTILSAVRLPQEEQWARAEGARFVHLMPKGGIPFSDDPTEQGVDVREEDLVIHNEGTPSELVAQAPMVLQWVGGDEKALQELVHSQLARRVEAAGVVS